MAPSLALRYTNSGSGDLAGVGWTVTGASRIHRCPRTRGHDGEVAPVRFTTQDRLCLYGRRLVVVVGTYGAASAEYRAEIDSFARITQLGGLDDARTCFRMEAKDGRTVTFGGCNDREAVDVPPGQVRPWAWAEERVTDRRWKPDQVRLRGGGRTASPPDDPLHRLRRRTRQPLRGRAYEGRPDVEIAYHAQGAVRSVRRLRAVTSYAGNTVARRYQFVYGISPATGRSLLQGLRMCKAALCDDTNSLPRTVFSYQGVAASFAAERVPAADPLLEKFQPVADYDGDGKRDLLLKGLVDARGTYFPLLPGALEWCHRGPRPTLSMVFDRASSNRFNAPDLDFDSDGRADLWGTLGGTFAIASWNPTRGTFQTRASNLPLPSAPSRTIQLTLQRRRPHGCPYRVAGARQADGPPPVRGQPAGADPVLRESRRQRPPDRLREDRPGLGLRRQRIPRSSFR